MRKQKGFTLIELLTVMTIIAVLAGLALVSYGGARKTARDGKRKADLEEIRSAMEMCYADDNRYPGVSFGNPLICVSGNKYLDSVPVDPINSGSYIYTVSGSSATSYTICARLETTGLPYCVSNP